MKTLKAQLIEGAKKSYAEYLSRAYLMTIDEAMKRIAEIQEGIDELRQSGYPIYDELIKSRFEFYGVDECARDLFLY